MQGRIPHMILTSYFSETIRPSVHTATGRQVGDTHVARRYCIIHPKINDPIWVTRKFTFTRRGVLVLAWRGMYVIRVQRGIRSDRVRIVSVICKSGSVFERRRCPGFAHVRSSLIRRQVLSAMFHLPNPDPRCLRCIPLQSAANIDNGHCSVCGRIASESG